MTKQHDKAKAKLVDAFYGVWECPICHQQKQQINGLLADLNDLFRGARSIWCDGVRWSKERNVKSHATLG